MSDMGRSIELEVDVEGTPDEVWRAIATGPGISSWYVPHTIEEKAGGLATASFGPGMDVDGRVAAWEPPSRVVFDGGDVDAGLSFEWLVVLADNRPDSRPDSQPNNSRCVVRLVNSGFPSGPEGDDYVNAMTAGWRLFLSNLQLHLRHFSGQSATAMLPMATWPQTRDAAWTSLIDGLGIPSSTAVGDRLEFGVGGSARLVGSVANLTDHNLVLVVEEPAPGTAFIAAEGSGDETMVSIWAYLYGEEGAKAVEADDGVWRNWLNERA